MMPGMDGWEVLANLRLNKKTKDIPVILLKAEHTLSDIDKAHARRVDDFILKPFDSETLGKTVESKLRASKKR
jgi:CheY-like chemotaxis protein